MKYAVSATGNSLDSAIDPRFGRAPYFIVVDSDSGNILSVIDNKSAMDAAHGAGINAASMVAESGAEAVLTGSVGPKAYAVLEQAGIKIISDASGTVKQAVEAQNNSPAGEVSGPTSDGHVGIGQGQGAGQGPGCRRTGGSGMGLGRGMGQGQGMGQGRGCGCRGGGGKGRGR